MEKRILLALVAVVSSTVGLFLWLDYEPATAVESPIVALADEPEFANESDLVRPVERAETSPPSENLAKREVASLPTADAGVEQSIGSPEKVVWVEGRVVFPEGVPLGEEVWIVGKGRRLADGTYHRAQVGPDGRFRVALRDFGRTARLLFEGRYLYSSAIRFELDTPPDEAVFEPELGGRIVCEMPWSEAIPWAPGELVGGTVGVETGGVHALADVEGDLSFDLGPLPPGEVTLTGMAFGPQIHSFRDTFELAPGEVLQLQGEFNRGVTIRGRLVDDDGDPVSAAAVFLSSRGRADEGEGIDAWIPGTTLRTDTLGEFGARGIAPGEYRLSVVSGAHLPLTHDLGFLADGDVVEDLLLVAARGLTIEGMVRFPGGKPAAGVSVRAGGPNSRSASSDAQGRFSLSGLTAGTYTVSATLSSVSLGPRAEVAEVRPPVQGLVLQFEEGHELRGRVTDAAGAPVSKYKVSVFARNSDGDFPYWGGAFVRDNLGEFLLSGVPEETCEVRVFARGYGQARTERFAVPRVTPVLVVLEREGAIEGLVLDPFGQPVPGAAVSIRATTPSRSDGDEKRRTRQRTSHSSGTETDARGRYELEGVDPGEYTLSARADGFAVSEELTCDVLPGERREEIALQLRPAARILGRIDESVGDREQLSVSAWGRSHGTVQVDENGEFVFEDLEAGEYHLQVRREGSFSSLSGSRFRTRLSLAEGETKHVLLGERGEVLVQGRLTAGGVALAGRGVTAFDPGARREFAAESETDTDGRFQIWLERPGAHEMRVHAGRPGFGAHTERVEVPDIPEVPMVLDVPPGRVTVTVMLASGRPPSRRKRVAIRSPELPGMAIGTVSDEGVGTFEYLAPGEYEVTAGTYEELGSFREGHGSGTLVRVSPSASHPTVYLQVDE